MDAQEQQIQYGEAVREIDCTVTVRVATAELG
jgi:hypothetical protein